MPPKNNITHYSNLTFSIEIVLGDKRKSNIVSDVKIFDVLEKVSFYAKKFMTGIEFQISKKLQYNRAVNE